ncbi:MAG TPA: hypothetical protein VME45_04670 [Stellaceae bacterium]|nr:hypothetical protein [Stellaceae bacterium]
MAAFAGDDMNGEEHEITAHLRGEDPVKGEPAERVDIAGDKGECDSRPDLGELQRQTRRCGPSGIAAHALNSSGLAGFSSGSPTASTRAAFGEARVAWIAGRTSSGRSQ